MFNTTHEMGVQNISPLHGNACQLSRDAPTTVLRGETVIAVGEPRPTVARMSPARVSVAAIPWSRALPQRGRSTGRPPQALLPAADAAAVAMGMARRSC